MSRMSMAATDCSLDDERTPLLPGPSSGDQNPVDKRVDAIPWLQIAVLCYARMIEGWNWYSIFSYVAEYVEAVGVEQSKIGFYTGLIESIYSVTQFVAMQFIWRWASDRYGRRPVLIVTLAGLSVSAVGFGFSTSVWHMIFFRSLGGVFSGSLITVRIMFSELSTPSTRARIFSLFSFSGALSMFLAPLTGGLLARPADRFEAFKGLAIFHKYPYLLPFLSTGVIGGLACALCVVFSEETRPWEHAEDVKLPSTMSILRSRGVGTVICINVWAAFTGFAYLTVLPLFWYTKPALGGLGLSSQAISLFMAISGVFQAVLLVSLCPPLQKHYGTDGLLLRAGLALASNCTLQPLLNLMAQRYSLHELYVFMLGGVVLMGVQGMTFNAIQVAIAEVCPSPEAMGKINSLSVSSGIAVRAITPALATSIFAFGVDRHILYGHLFWILLAVASSGYCVFIFGSSGTLRAASECGRSEVKVPLDDESSV